MFINIFLKINFHFQTSYCERKVINVVKVDIIFLKINHNQPHSIHKQMQCGFVHVHLLNNKLINSEQLHVTYI